MGLKRQDPGHHCSLPPRTPPLAAWDTRGPKEGTEGKEAGEARVSSEGKGPRETACHKVTEQGTGNSDLSRRALCREWAK